MLKIFNNLGPFIEDTQLEIHVREFAKLQHISPPTASKILSQLEYDGLLLKTEDKRYNLFRANRTELFVVLARAYWQQKLTPLLNEINKKTFSSTVVLFGSLSKAENTTDSDIDLVIFSKRSIKLPSFFLDKELQVFFFESFEHVPENLREAILNGHVLQGKWKI